VLREILPPTLLGLGAYTFLLLLRSVLQLSELFVRRGIPFSTIFDLLLLTMPQILVLTIPMAFLFGILIGVGRLSGDSEIIALGASGESRWALLRPVAALSLFLAVLVSILSVWGYPAANDRLDKMQNRLFASAALDMVKPRVFAAPRTDWDWVLFVDRDAPGAAGWRGVFLDDRSDPSQERVILAREGRFRIDGDRLWLDLKDAVQHSTQRTSPRIYSQSRNKMLSILIHETPPAAHGGSTTSEKGLRLQTLPELFRTAERERGLFPERYRLAWVEIHKKFAIPVACVVFALVGVPLGITNRRGGKGSGFAVSIGIILGYYLLFNTGENWAEDGRISPAVSMWLPNALLALLGAALLLKRERERRSLRERFAIWRKSLPKPKNFRPITDSRPVSLSGLARFPARIDRYILSPFLAALLAIYATVGFLYLIVDYSDHADDILKRHIPAAVVNSYYRALLLPIAVQIFPFCILLAALVALAALSRNNEDTAFRACGIPLLRLGVPILFFSIAAAGVAYVCGEYFLPAANQRMHQELDRIKGRAERPPAAQAGGVWVLGGDGYRIWNFDWYDPRTRRLWNPSIFEFDRDFQMVRRVSGSSAQWNGAAWTFESGWVRHFQGPVESLFQEFRVAPLVEGDPPRLFAALKQRPDEMRYRALARYVSRLEKTGYPVAPLATALAGKPASAAQAVVLALLAIPFAFTIGKRGALTGIGIGLACGMLFLVLAAFFTKLGEVGSLPPVLAAWSPNLIFSLLAGYRLTRLRT
jgi:LPS export ABC transporter permease LptF/LPS export ABC transporter permease LptG